MSAYTNCFVNLPSAEAIASYQKQQDLELELVFRVVYGWAILPLASLGIISTMVFIACCFKAIKSCRVPRKCYVLFMNCGIGDILSCTSALVICCYVLISDKIDRNILTGVESFFIGSFWSTMVSYCSLSVLKLFAVWKPVHYRKWFTMRRCIIVIIISWTILVITASYTLIISALVNFQWLHEWSGCRAETCLRLMFKIRSSLTATAYCFTILVFLITVFLIKRSQTIAHFVNHSQSVKSRMLRFPLWKISINVATFGSLNLPYVLWCIFIVVNPVPCLFLRNQVDMMKILGTVRCFLVIRCFVDPVQSFVTDSQLRRCLLQTFCPKMKTESQVTPRRTRSMAVPTPSIILSANSIVLNS